MRMSAPMSQGPSWGESLPANEPGSVRSFSLGVGGRSRYVTRENIFGAAVIATGESPGKTEGVGDAVLVDLKNSFVALSDGSGRNPSFSREILLNLSRLAETTAGRGLRSPRCIEDGDCIREFMQSVETLTGGLTGRGSATLSAMFFTGDGEATRYVLFHTGDSRIYRSGRGVDTLISRSNFWLVGKSQNLFQVETGILDRDEILLVMSDGWHDDIGNCGGNIVRALKENHIELYFQTIDAVCNGEHFRDDCSLIIVSPGEMVRHRINEKVLIGGTRKDFTEMHDAGVSLVKEDSVLDDVMVELADNPVLVIE